MSTVSLSDLYAQPQTTERASSPGVQRPTPFSAQQATAGQGTASGATAAQAAGPGPLSAARATASQGAASSMSGPTSFNSQDASASYAGTRDAAAFTGSLSRARADAGQTGYNAQTGELDDSASSASQLNRITSQDSPLMRRARQAAMDMAARRGLTNSSFAAGAGMGEMVDRATPLAIEDARAGQQFGLENLRQAAAMEQMNAQLQTETSQFNAGQSNEAARLNAQLETAVSQGNAQEANRIRTRLTELEQQAAAANMGAENDMAQLNAQLQTAVSQGNTQAENAIRTRMAELQQQTALANADAQTRVSMGNAQMQTEMSQLNAQLQTAVSEGNAQQANAIRTRMAELEQQARAQTADLQAQTSQFNAQQFNALNADVLRMNTEINRQFMAGEQAMDLAQIQGRYNQLLSANETAARMYQSYFDSIAASMANPDISPGRVAQYVNVQQSMLEAGLRMMDQMNNIDLGEFELPGARGTGAGSNEGIMPTPGSGVTAQPPVTPTNPDGTPSDFQFTPGGWMEQRFGSLRGLTDGQMAGAM